MVGLWAGPGHWARLANCVGGGLATPLPGKESRLLAFPLREPGGISLALGFQP